MKITMEIVVRLYELKDPKRRRMLFEYYQAYFDQRYSAGFIVEIINADLGKDLITVYDVKYVRAKSRKWLATVRSDASPDIRVGIPEIFGESPKTSSWSRTEPKPFTNPSKKIKL